MIYELFLAICTKSPDINMIHKYTNRYKTIIHYHKIIQNLILLPEESGNFWNFLIFELQYTKCIDGRLIHYEHTIKIYKILVTYN